MKKILTGFAQFQKAVYPGKRRLFRKLADGQSPQALFITCADSRIDPNLITQTDPGDLFVCRNAGNIVPPYSGTGEGMSASVEYAVAALKVPHIIVCGHSGCGAMGAVMHPESAKGLPHVGDWLVYSQAAMHAVKAGKKHRSEKARMNALIERNVLLQLDHLRTHPHVAALLAAGKTQLHGWVYDIGTGKIVEYDESAGRFVALAEPPSRRRAAKKA